jgi:predicted nucleic acid-binding protein
MLVVDASVVVKCLTAEPDSIAARQIVASADSLLAPELIYSETANALWKTARRHRLSMPQALHILDAVWSLPLDALPLAGLTSDALKLAIAHDHPVYDCYYLAAAIRRDCAIVTADRRLYDLALRVGFGERALLVH